MAGEEAPPPGYETTTLAFPEASGSDSLRMNMENDQQVEIENEYLTPRMKRGTMQAEYVDMKTIDNPVVMVTEDIYENMADNAAGTIAVTLKEVEYSLQRLQKLLQNSEVRRVALTTGTTHISPILQALKWLPVRQRIIFEVILLVYQAPQYTSSYIQDLVHEPPRRLRSSCSHPSYLHPKFTALLGREGDRFQVLALNCGTHSNLTSIPHLRNGFTSPCFTRGMTSKMMRWDGQEAHFKCLKGMVRCEIGACSESYTSDC
eukprot:XP_011666225.1 PREDICTED: uncharacterized protein LOC105439204 [Strongylocentrotus purpuratus]